MKKGANEGETGKGGKGGGDTGNRNRGAEGMEMTRRGGNKARILWKSGRETLRGDNRGECVSCRVLRCRGHGGEIEIWKDGRQGKANYQ